MPVFGHNFVQFDLCLAITVSSIIFKRCQLQLYDLLSDQNLQLSDQKYTNKFSGIQNLARFLQDF